MLESIRAVQPNNAAGYRVPQFTGCIVLSSDNCLLLQKRRENFYTFPGMIATFGGKIELNESPVQAVIRELNEELGATVLDSELYQLGMITESYTQYQDLIHTYFWHDKNSTITGCYEGELLALASVEEALTQEKLMDDARWMLSQCVEKQLINQ